MDKDNNWKEVSQDISKISNKKYQNKTCPVVKIELT